MTARCQTQHWPESAGPAGAPAARGTAPARWVGAMCGSEGAADLGPHPTAACSSTGPDWQLLPALVFLHALLEIPPALVFLPGLQVGVCAPTISNCTVPLGTSCRGTSAVPKEGRILLTATLAAPSAPNRPSLAVTRRWRPLSLEGP